MGKIDPCILPWIELHINTLGQLKTCCAQFDYLETNKGEPLNSVFNGENFKAIRTQFLSGQTPRVCEACVKAESNGMSYKTVKSKQWSAFAPQVLAVENQVSKFPIKFLDLRFGNTCNFACRTCDSDNSSRWQRLDQTVGRNSTVSQRVPKDVLLNQIFTVLDEVEEIYFAGGEPLMSEEHYLVLEEIIRRKKTGIKITYNTNLSLLSSHGRDVIDLWKKLDQVVVYPSIDGIGKKGEYIRTGLKWEHFESNFQKIRQYVGCLHSVLSAYNVIAISDLVLWSLEQNAMLSVFPAYHPLEISASVLPPEIRREGAEKLRQIISDRNLGEWQRTQLVTAVEFLEKNHTPEHLAKFVKFNRALDSFHKTDFSATFPEHLIWQQDL